MVDPKSHESSCNLCAVSRVSNLIFVRHICKIIPTIKVLINMVLVPLDVAARQGVLMSCREPWFGDVVLIWLRNALYSTW